MSDYPEGYGRCIMCGADRNQPCTVISGTGEPGWSPGDRREVPHSGRPPIGSDLEPAEGFVAVKNEPNHYADQPHTEQCGPDCPLRWAP